MVTLHDNPFSPFARKVRLALALKRVPFESVDALDLGRRAELLALNPRGEVPVLVDGELVVAGSADIVAYLEDRVPSPPLLPGSAALRAKARRWQRLADTVIDAIVHDLSLWMWPTHERHDTPPPGLLEAGHRDLARILERLEGELGEAGFVCGELSVADLALFPHVSSFRVLGVELDPYPRVRRWNRDLRALPAVRDDLEHVKRMARERFEEGPSPYESESVVWRGDRIEWLLARGFHRWFAEELASGRAVVPEPL